MSKSVLGRGLSILLGERKGEEESGDASHPAGPAGEPHMGPGVGTLLRGKQSLEAPPPFSAPQVFTTTPTQIRWLTVALAAMDFWLCAIMILILLRSKSVEWVDVLLSTSIVGVGAGLGCLAVWLRSKT